MKTCYYIIFLFTLALPFGISIIATSNIFDDVPTCKFKTHNSTIHINSRPVTITKFRMQIILSPCDPIQFKRGCDPTSLVCVLQTRDTEGSIANAGKQFILIERTDEDNPGTMQLMLQSLYGNRCAADPSRNYTTYLTFGKNFQPKLTDFNECEFHIQILDPNIELPCTKQVDSHLLDFRQLSGEMQIKSVGRTFLLNLCGPAKGCGGNSVSACEISGNNQPLSIGNLDTQSITYSEDKHIEIRYRSGMGRRRLETSIYLKCNWTVIKANSQFVVPVSQSTRKYKFVVESHLGCVKTPMSCHVQDFDNHKYNLQNLYRPNSYWNVSGVKIGQIKLNMCGPLKPSLGLCEANQSQVCLSDLKGNQINYGSILTHFKVNNDILEAKFSDGSICPKNRSLTLSTSIVFKCSRFEQGPILQSLNNCSIQLLWETPEACPHYISSGQNCYISDFLGNRDLSGIHQTIDGTYKLNKKSFVRYNLCGDLVAKCNGVSNASICLHLANNKQYILGFNTSSVNSNDGILSSHLSGEECNELGFRRTVNVSFICSYDAPKSGVVTIKVIRDQCTYVMIVATPLACVSTLPTSNTCSIVQDNRFYDLTPLSRLDKNYVIPVQSQNLTYSINICRPSLTTDDALCISNTGVCLRNSSQPNFKYKFYSTGAVQKLTVENGELQLRYSFGKLCSRLIESSSIIHFNCSSAKDKITFLKESNCVHEFTWSTRHACPKKLQIPRSLLDECVLEDKTGKNFNLSYARGRILELRVNNTEGFRYKFNLCSDDYVKILSGNEIVNMKSQRRLINSNRNFYVEYQLNGTCLENGGVDSVQVNLMCDLKSQIGSFLFKNTENCTVFMDFYAREICYEKKYLVDVTETTERLIPDNKISLVVKANENNCTIMYKKVSINLNTIKRVSIISPKNIAYTIGMDKSSLNCAGFICREHVAIATLEECPHAEVTNSDIRIYFPHGVVIQFICNSSRERPSVLKDEDNVTLTYPIQEMCALKRLDERVPLTTVGAIVGAILSFVVLVIFIVMLKRKLNRSCHQTLLPNKSKVYLY